MWVPLTTATLSDISRAKMANATGVYTLVRQLGGSLGIAILQLIEIRASGLRLCRARLRHHLANHNVSHLLHGAPTRASS